MIEKLNNLKQELKQDGHRQGYSLICDVVAFLESKTCKLQLAETVIKQRQENTELKTQVELLLSALEVGFSSGEDHDIDVWEDETKALINKLREGEV